MLLDHGADASIRDVRDYTAFHFAIRNRKLQHQYHILERLLAKEDNLNQGVMGGLTPLHLAAGTTFLRSAQWLLGKGAVLECKDNYSRTPLHVAAASLNPESPDVVTFLVNKDLSVNDQDEGEMALLHHALYTYDRPGRKYDPDVSLANVRILLENGADLEAQDSEGNTVLHLAAWRGQASIVRYMLSWGADVNKTDKKGYRPVSLAQQEELRRLLGPKSLISTI